MLGWLIIGGLLGLSAACVVLRKAYLDDPLIETHQNSGHTNLKSRSIRSTKREHVLSIFLQFVSVLSFTVFAILSAEYLPSLAALILIALSLIYIFFVLPNSSIGGFSAGLANFTAPVFVTFLNKTKKQTRALEKSLTSYQTRHKTAKKLNKLEIIEFLDHQKSLSEGRTLAFELAGAQKTLEIIAKKATNYMLKFDELHLVGDKESVGPVLIDELHKSQRRTFLVNSKEHGIIGTVDIKDLMDLKDGGQISKVYDPIIEFIDEDQDVRELLEQFATSGKTIFVVTDNEGEKIGAVYIEDVINYLIG